MKTNRKKLRIVVGLAVLVIAVVAGQVNGSFPIGTLCALCPAGFAQLVAASKSIPWGLVPGVLALIALTVLLGRFFCSWLCPSQLLKNIFGGHKPRGMAGRSKERICRERPVQIAESSQDACSDAADIEKPRTASGCSACAAGGADFKSQVVVFGGLLLVSFVVGFPVFCLFCPIGLVFGTLWALNRLFVFLQPGWELVIFPLMLFVELFFFKRWCTSVCPLGFVFALVGKLRAKFGFGLHPRSNCSACKSKEGCEVCATACPENIDISDNGKAALESCSMCLDCVENCPAHAISLKLTVPRNEEPKDAFAVEGETGKRIE